MGMFDTIVCEMPLPGAYMGPKDDFQTKDLDCQLDTFTINAVGRLIHHYREWEATPESDKPYPNATDWRSAFGCIREKAGSQRLVDRNYHGFIEFYTTDAAGEWWEWRAKFTDGTCVSIELVSGNAAGGAK